MIDDDEPTYRAYLGSFLRRRGFEVRAAETGREAIEIARTFSPDFLLADWMLRCEMRGIQVGETLRSDSPELRILLMTGFPRASLEAETARVGINSFLEKPFALEDLEAALIEQRPRPSALLWRAFSPDGWRPALHKEPSALIKSRICALEERRVGRLGKLE